MALQSQRELFAIARYIDTACAELINGEAM
jgi:hypothetical protein